MTDSQGQQGHDGNNSKASESGCITINITRRKQNYTFQFPDDATVPDLFKKIESSLGIDQFTQKIIVSKCGILKAPFKEPHTALRTLQNKPMMLMGSGIAEILAVENMSSRLSSANKPNTMRTRKPVSKKANNYADDAKYSFLQVRPLDGLPNPEMSRRLLTRLAKDPGIRAVMKKHKFTVSLLTEMEPLSHTQVTHEGTSRILGLNRNQGEVIELRLRTDAHDGYRDYKTIRKTLCHELAHNVHGPHDEQFWHLCRQIEGEVKANDWTSRGFTLDETARRVMINDSLFLGDSHEDEGGWTGGEFVLGGVSHDGAAMSRRDILAQAALVRKEKQEAFDRQRKQDEAEREARDVAVGAQKPGQPSQQPSDKND